VVRSASRIGRLYPNEYSWYSFSLGAESTPGPWNVRKEISLKNPSTPLGIDPGTVQLITQRLNHYTTPGPYIHIYIYIYIYIYIERERGGEREPLCVCTLCHFIPRVFCAVATVPLRIVLQVMKYQILESRGHRID
jgi:hypothetical protein